MHLLVGQNNQAGKSILKTDYDETNSVDLNLKVAVKILLKTMDATAPSADRIELSTLRLTGPENKEVVHYTLKDEEVKTYIDMIQAEMEAEQKKSEASTGDI